MGTITIWAHGANIKEIDGEQGFVEVDEELGNKLIEQGVAQDIGVGGLLLKELEDPGQPEEKRRKKTEAAKVEPPKNKALSASGGGSYLTKKK